MNILFLARKFYPQIGGVEKHCLEVGKRLVEMGNEVTVVTEGGQESIKKKVLSIKERDEKDGIKIFRILITTSEKKKKFQIWGWLWKNRKLIEEADVIHCHDVFFWYLPFRFLYPKKKVFTTFHGWEGKFPPSFKAKLIRKISEKLSLGNICVGDYITKWYGTKADWVTYGAVELTQNSKIKDQNQISKLKTILFIGRLEDDTGLPLYLKALEILRGQEGLEGPYFAEASRGKQEGQGGLEITFLGDGSLRKDAEKYGSVLGFVREVENYLRDSRFVFASGYLSILEAMINKKLVFAVFDNLLKEDYLKMAPFNKWIVIDCGPEGLAEKVKFFFNNPKKEKKLVEEGYNWAREQSWEKLTERYLRLWRRE